jgi:hypothetical protein
MRNVFELIWGVDEFLPDPFRKLDCCDKIANAKTKTHRDSKHNSVISIGEDRPKESRWRESKSSYGFASMSSALNLMRLDCTH